MKVLRSAVLYTALCLGANAALADPATSTWREQLLITGFSPMTGADYGELPRLARRAELALGRDVRP